MNFENVYESVFDLTPGIYNDKYYGNSKGQLIKRKNMIKMNKYLFSKNVRTDNDFKQFLIYEKIDDFLKLTLFIDYNLSDDS